MCQFQKFCGGILFGAGIVYVIASFAAKEPPNNYLSLGFIQIGIAVLLWSKEK